MEKKRIIVDITESDFEQHMLRMGDRIQLYFPPEDFLVFPAGKE
jgi:hypothetical protein